MPAVRTPSKQVEAVHVYPMFGEFMQDPADTSSAEQSPVPLAFAKSVEASQVANNENGTGKRVTKERAYAESAVEGQYQFLMLHKCSRPQRCRS